MTKDKWGNILISIICPSCGKLREVPKTKISRNNYTKLCRSCWARKIGNINKDVPQSKGNKSNAWKSGRVKHRGYVLVHIDRDSPLYSMANKDGYVAEHRLVMAKHLDRYLLPYEIVHHKNSIKTDNRLENLELLSSVSDHVPSMRLNLYIKELQNRIDELEKELKER